MKKMIRRKTQSKSPHGGRRNWWKGIFLILFGIVSLKLSLTFGLFFDQSQKKNKWIEAQEVMAQDSQVKAPDSAAPGALPGAQQISYAPSSSSGSGLTITEKISYLEQREADLMRKEKEIQQKQDYLKQMEQDIEKKLQELAAIQKDIQTFRSEREANQNAKIRSLAKIYESMKPKEAAKLLENLEEQLVVSIISTMNIDCAASILAGMDTKKAAKISQVLSSR